MMKMFKRRHALRTSQIHTNQLCPPWPGAPILQMMSSCCWFLWFVLSLSLMKYNQYQDNTKNVCEAAAAVSSVSNLMIRPSAVSQQPLPPPLISSLSPIPARSSSYQHSRHHHNQHQNYKQISSSQQQLQQTPHVIRTRSSSSQAPASYQQQHQRIPSLENLRDKLPKPIQMSVDNHIPIQHQLHTNFQHRGQHHHQQIRPTIVTNEDIVVFSDGSELSSSTSQQTGSAKQVKRESTSTPTLTHQAIKFEITTTLPATTQSSSNSYDLVPTLAKVGQHESNHQHHHHQKMADHHRMGSSSSSGGRSASTGNDNIQLQLGFNDGGGGDSEISSDDIGNSSVINLNDYATTVTRLYNASGETRSRPLWTELLKLSGNKNDQSSSNKKHHNNILHNNFYNSNDTNSPFNNPFMGMHNGNTAMATSMGPIRITNPMAMRQPSLAEYLSANAMMQPNSFATLAASRHLGANSLAPGVTSAYYYNPSGLGLGPDGSPSSTSQSQFPPFDPTPDQAVTLDQGNHMSSSLMSENMAIPAQTLNDPGIQFWLDFIEAAGNSMQNIPPGAAQLQAGSTGMDSQLKNHQQQHLHHQQIVGGRSQGKDPSINGGNSRQMVHSSHKQHDHSQFGAKTNNNNNNNNNLLSSSMNQKDQAGIGSRNFGGQPNAHSLNNQQQQPVVENQSTTFDNESNLDNTNENVGDSNGYRPRPQRPSPKDQSRSTSATPSTSSSSYGSGGGNNGSGGGGAHKDKPISNKLPPSADADADLIVQNTAPRCDKFTPDICVDDFEYPEQAIVDEIQKKRDLFELMYSEVKDNEPLVDGIPRDVEESYNYEYYYYGKNILGPTSAAASSHTSSSSGGNSGSSPMLVTGSADKTESALAGRSATMDHGSSNRMALNAQVDQNGIIDGMDALIGAVSPQASMSSASASTPPSSGFICPSEVMYGKPKLAKNKKGLWKVIVNAGEFTQTVRLEKCLLPNNRCNYVSVSTFQSRCAQVHSYHRLLVFEKGKGFYIDTFRMPTGCNCHVTRKPAKLAQSGSGQTQITNHESPTQSPSYNSNNNNIGNNGLIGIHNNNQQDNNSDNNIDGYNPNAGAAGATGSSYSGNSNSLHNSNHSPYNQLRGTRQQAVTVLPDSMLSHTLWSILNGGKTGMEGPDGLNGGEMSPVQKDAYQSQSAILEQLRHRPDLAAHISDNVLRQLIDVGLANSAGTNNEQVVPFPSIGAENGSGPRQTQYPSQYQTTMGYNKQSYTQKNNHRNNNNYTLNDFLSSNELDDTRPGSLLSKPNTYSKYNKHYQNSSKLTRNNNNYDPNSLLDSLSQDNQGDSDSTGGPVQPMIGTRYRGGDQQNSILMPNGGDPFVWPGSGGGGGRRQNTGNSNNKFRDSYQDSPLGDETQGGGGDNTNQLLDINHLTGSLGASTKKRYHQQRPSELLSGSGVDLSDNQRHSYDFAYIESNKIRGPSAKSSGGQNPGSSIKNNANNGYHHYGSIGNSNTNNNNNNQHHRHHESTSFRSPQSLLYDNVEPEETENNDGKNVDHYQHKPTILYTINDANLAVSNGINISSSIHRPNMVDTLNHLGLDYEGFEILGAVGSDNEERTTNNTTEFVVFNNNDSRAIDNNQKYLDINSNNNFGNRTGQQANENYANQSYAANFSGNRETPATKMTTFIQTSVNSGNSTNKNSTSNEFTNNETQTRDIKNNNNNLNNNKKPTNVEIERYVWQMASSSNRSTTRVGPEQKQVSASTNHSDGTNGTLHGGGSIVNNVNGSNNNNSYELTSISRPINSKSDFNNSSTTAPTITVSKKTKRLINNPTSKSNDSGGRIIGKVASPVVSLLDNDQQDVNNNKGYLLKEKINFSYHPILEYINDTNDQKHQFAKQQQ